MAYGYRVEEARCLYPRAAQALDAIPGLQTAFFSVLRPGAHLPLHRGPYKGVVRYHLGLVVPEDARACRIQVGGIERHWEFGRGMFFDDSYPHQVWNETPQTRVVLFLDVERPMRFPANWLNRAIIRAIGISPFIRDFRRRHRRWARGFFAQRTSAAGSDQGAGGEG